MPRRRHVVALANGPREQVERMCADLRRELPGFEHHLVEGGDWLSWIERFPPFSIAHTAALWGPGTERRAFWHAFALAPTRLLAYDAQGERFHLHPKQFVSSLLFLAGKPVHEIHLRPWRDDSVHYDEVHELEGCPPRAGLPTVGVLTPYLPWPLSHGGAVRIHALLREGASVANQHLFAFLEEGEEAAAGPLVEFCTRITLVRKAKFQRLRWASLDPPEVLEHQTAAMQRAWRGANLDLRQVEFTQMASYGGDILVEHDITMDLAEQEYRRSGTAAAWWDWRRWKRYEQAALPQFRAVVVMSDKDRAQIAHPRITVIPNGVDLARFQPHADAAAEDCVFIGSFRHFPNALAYRFLAEEVWPRVAGFRLTAVAGPKAETYYPWGPIPRPAGVTLHGFVARVEDLYAQAAIALIPTPVSAGTNIKALEAMACGKAIVATPSGVNGLGLEDGKEVLLAESAADFAGALERLRGDPALRSRLGAAARRKAETEFGWNVLGQKQADLWRRLAALKGAR